VRQVFNSRYFHRLLVVAASLFATVGLADIDLSDFDDDLMRSMDDSIKSFEPNIASKNAARAMDDARILWDGLKWTEEYFEKKGGAADAVTISKQALEYTGAVMKYLEANDFENAATAARSAAKTCRTCHDIYKSS